MSKWFVKVCAGDSSLDDAPWLGRSADIDSNQIKTVNKNDQCYTMQEMDTILKISKLIKLLLKMKNVSFILQKNKQTF